MYIVKDLNDFRLSKKQRVFVDFISDKIGTYSSYEKIKNIDYMRKYVSPHNDFLAYASALPYEQIHRLRVNQQKNTFCS